MISKYSNQEANHENKYLQGAQNHDSNHITKIRIHISTKKRDRDLRGGTRSEGNGGIVDGEISCVENDETSIGDYVEVDGNSSGEGAGDEIGIEAEIVALGDGELG